MIEKGTVFGRLTVIERQIINHRGYYSCKCECGNTVTIRGDALTMGRTHSCGCLIKENAITGKNRRDHGLWGTRLHRIWGAMKTRCFNPNTSYFKNYGGRGITICDEWLNDFKAFYDWAMSHGYADNLTIDRIDVNGNYEPSNCRWATVQEQNQNKRKRGA